MTELLVDLGRNWGQTGRFLVESHAVAGRVTV